MHAPVNIISKNISRNEHPANRKKKEPITFIDTGCRVPLSVPDNF